ncbi:acyltransferase family protein [Amycolatopsis sp. CA-126428]|uniref:acyltransferase family protein n=1 Tax=Amycolatopsis sp. CA-126428 TaxID=2073158 RepID=UPI000CD327D5|nr:acyltransferase [Amycolatopsis sp. CA-126428]
MDATETTDVLPVITGERRAEPAQAATKADPEQGPLPAFIPQLTGVRALAALWVLAFHFRPELVSSFPFLGRLAPLFDTGYLGVDLFFVLSGFIMTYTHLDRMSEPWTPRKALGFLWLRLSRIWPVMLLVLLGWALYRAYSLQVNNDASLQAAASPARFLEHVLLIQGWFIEPDQWNPIDWSLSAEWLAYLVFSVAVAVLAKMLKTVRVRSLVLCALVSVVPIVAIGVTMEDGSDLLLFHNALVPGMIPLRVLTEFFGGAFTALIVLRYGRSARLPWFLRPTVVFVVIVAIIFLVHHFDSFRRFNMGLDWRINGHIMWGSAETVVVVPLFLLLIGGLAIGNREPMAWLLRTRLLVWGGKVSFALYLVHWLVIDVMRHVIQIKLKLTDVPTSWEYRLIVLGFLALTILIAHVLHRFFEEPTRRAMRRMLPDSMRA